jgi:protein-S-isoprenylcysteine O-methyltransferase Ste14
VAAPYLQQETWASAVFSVSVAAFAAGELSQAIKQRRDSSLADPVGEVVFRAIFFAGILMLPLARSLASDAVLRGAGPFVLGAVVGCLGLLLRWWSFATLGPYFTTVLRTSVEQEIVDHGPYRLLRHPSYTGLLAAFLGAGLMIGNWVGTAASVLLVLMGLLFRIRREEEAMIDALGDAYVAFARGRARLIPYVW